MTVPDHWAARVMEARIRLDDGVLEEIEARATRSEWDRGMLIALEVLLDMRLPPRPYSSGGALDIYIDVGDKKSARCTICGHDFEFLSPELSDHAHLHQEQVCTALGYEKVRLGSVRLVVDEKGPRYVYNGDTPAPPISWEYTDDPSP